MGKRPWERSLRPRIEVVTAETATSSMTVDDRPGRRLPCLRKLTNIERRGRSAKLKLRERPIPTSSDNTKKWPSSGDAWPKQLKRADRQCSILHGRRQPNGRSLRRCPAVQSTCRNKLDFAGSWRPRWAMPRIRRRMHSWYLSQNIGNGGRSRHHPGSAGTAD